MGNKIEQTQRTNAKFRLLLLLILATTIFCGGCIWTLYIKRFDPVVTPAWYLPTVPNITRWFIQFEERVNKQEYYDSLYSFTISYSDHEYNTPPDIDMINSIEIDSVLIHLVGVKNPLRLGRGEKKSSKNYPEYCDIRFDSLLIPSKKDTLWVSLFAKVPLAQGQTSVSHTWMMVRDDHIYTTMFND